MNVENIKVAQEEIVAVLSRHVPPEQVSELRKILSDYFAEKAIKEFDRLAEENGWNEATYEQWLKERLRTPYS